MSAYLTNFWGQNNPYPQGSIEAWRFTVHQAQEQAAQRESLDLKLRDRTAVDPPVTHPPAPIPPAPIPSAPILPAPIPPVPPPPAPAPPEPEAYVVYPAALIKSTLINAQRSDLQVPGIASAAEQKQQKLAAFEHRSHQEWVLSQAHTVKAAAVQAHANKKLREDQLIRKAMQEGKELTNLDINTGGLLAQAARETLEAEEEVALRDLQLCETQIRSVEEELQDLRYRLKDAMAQETHLQALLYR